MAAVHDDQMCSACSVMLRPQVFQDVLKNDQVLTCDTCKRILYYVTPPPKPEEEKGKQDAESAVTAVAEPPTTP